MDTDAAPREIPLFPLQTVLFPGGYLPLRIFETRYTDMVARCLRESLPFGVVLITEGSETGSTRVVTVGTAASIVDWRRGEDGLLGVTGLGLSRFTLNETHVQADGLHLGEVAWMPEPAAQPLSESDRPLAAILASLLDQVGDAFAGMRTDYDDAGWVCARLAELLPVPLELRQRCLELNRVDDRLALVREFVRQLELPRDP